MASFTTATAEQLLQAAEKGEAAAQYHWAERIRNRRAGANLKPVDAVVWYEKAAKQGHGPALYQLAWYYRHGNGVAKDEKKADDLVLKSVPAVIAGANAGDADHQHCFGKIYAAGCATVQKDIPLAKSWFDKAIAQGSTGAMQEATSLYLYNNEWRDTGRAMELYKQMLAQGSDADKRLAANGLANIHRKLGDDAVSFEYLKQAADLQSDDAQFNIGMLYYKGKKPVCPDFRRDKESAAQWFDLAARNGNYNAMMMLGTIKQSAQDYHAAAGFYQQAAALDGLLPEQETAAHCAIGYTLSRAGMEAEAIAWLEKAAAQGHKHAQYELGRAYQRGRGVDADFDRAREYFMQAAAKNLHNEWAIELSWTYAYVPVLGFEPDTHNRHSESEMRGLADACRELGLMAAEGQGGPQSFDEAAEWFFKGTEIELLEHMELCSMSHEIRPFSNVEDGRTMRCFYQLSRLYGQGLVGGSLLSSLYALVGVAPEFAAEWLQSA